MNNRIQLIIANFLFEKRTILFCYIILKSNCVFVSARLLSMPTECLANPLQRALADAIILMKPMDEIRILFACGAKVWLLFTFHFNLVIVNFDLIFAGERTRCTRTSAITLRGVAKAYWSSSIIVGAWSWH